MARKIFITSDMSVDERLIEAAEQSPLAALLWPWLLTAFDDWGRAEAVPKRLKAMVFPANEMVSADDIATAIRLYAEKGLIVTYEANGKQYMAIPQDKWFKYQTHIRSEKRTNDASRFPAPPTRDDNRKDEVDAQVHALARTSAQVHADECSCTPSPSPSLSLSSTGTTPAIAPPTADKAAAETEQVAACGVQSPRTEPKPVSSEPKFGPGDPPYELAAHLRREILAHDPRTKVPPETPAGLARWSKDADLLLRLDQRPFEEARQVASFAAADPFWSQNILSVKKLRVHYDQLRKRMQVQGQAQTRASPYAAPPARAQPKSITDTAEERRRRLAALG